MFEQNLVNYGGFSLQSAITDKPVFQKRTGKHRQFVFWNDRTVVKGPYVREDVEKIYKKSEELKRYNCENFIYPIGYHTLSDPVDSKNKKTFFIVYNNIAQDSSFKTYSHKETFSDLTLQVIERNEVVKLNDSLDYDWLTPYYPSLLYTLVCMRIINVGDMCLSNIIVNVNTKQVYIIDYDYNKEEDRKSEDFYFSKSPSKDKLLVWLNNVKPHYEFVLNKLKDYINEDRVLVVYNMLMKFHKGEQNDNMGKMKYIGPLSNNISYNGFETDVLKSGLQKYIRRNIFEKAIMCAHELYKFNEIDDGKRIQSNMYNRLAVIASEDIGPANISLVINCINIVKKDERNIKELVDLVYNLCGSYKTRCGSWYANTYFTETGVKLGREKGIIFDDELEKLNINIWLKDDPKEIQDYGNMFYKRLSERSLLCFVWLDKYMKSCKDLKVVARNRRTDPMIIIWSFLKNFMDKTIYETLLWAFFKFTERNTFLMTAILTVLHNVEYTETKLFELDFNVDKLVKCDYLLEIDDYVVDTHTRKGRSNGMNRSDFVKEGSLVIPEHTFFKNEVYEYVYANHK